MPRPGPSGVSELVVLTALLSALKGKASVQMAEEQGRALAGPHLEPGERDACRLSISMTLGVLFNSLPQFIHLYNRDNDRAFP